MSEQDELQQLRNEIAMLSTRVHRLEQSLRASSAPATPATQSTEPETSQPGSERSLQTTRMAAPPKPSIQTRPTQPESLERRIGSLWLNRIGVVAVLVGVSYFLKLAFDYGWIGPDLRVLVGLIAGVALCWWSERFRVPNSLAFSYSLKAVGVGILYLSLWASFQLYHLVPGTIAFLAMLVVTAATAGIALAQNAELLAALALLGGLLTPVLCSAHENQEAALFCYLLLLSLGAFVLQRVRHWPRILLGAFVGSALLGSAWYSSYYTNDQFAESLLFFTLLFALFAVAPHFAKLEPERDRPTRQTGFLLTILNAGAYFAAVYSQLLTSGTGVRPRAAAYALGLAILYSGLGAALDRRVSEHPGVERLLPVVHYGLAITFLTIGVALELRQHWITLGWLIEGALLFWAGASTGRRRVKLFSAIVVILGILRLLTLDLFSWGVQSGILNERLVTFGIAVAALLWMVYLDYRSEDRENDRDLLAMAVVAANLLILLAIGFEIHDIFTRLIRETQIATAGPAPDGMEAIGHSFVIARNFSYSALFMFYGAGLMWMGFSRRSALLRWQAILLMAASTIKVFVFDISALDRGLRVLGFVILGALLLGISYAYQRNTHISS